MRFYPLIFLALIGGALAPGRVAAWHSHGHMTIARIAYKEFDDAQRKLLHKILKAHPHYARYLAAECPTDVAEPEWAFMRAAVWPDWVRRNSSQPRPDEDELVNQYHRGPWHYINLPYVWPADQGKVDTKGFPQPARDKNGDPGHVLTALKKAAEVLRQVDATDETKAIYLCWLLHLIGDLHQPLHCSTLISAKTPTGDLGGNLVAVKVKEGEPAVLLHTYWDALQFGDQMTYKDVLAKSDEWAREADLQRDQLSELKATEIQAWAEEGLELAKKVAYWDGKLEFLVIDSKTDGFNRMQMSKLPAPLLPAGYDQAAREVARRRMTVAAYRITDQLKAALK